MNIKIFILAILLANLSYANKAQTTLQVYIPSGVTSNLSRVYNNIIKDFEEINPNIKIIFNPKNSYKQTQEVLLSLTNSKQSAGVVVIELSELLTLVQNNSVIPLDLFINEDKKLLDTFIPKFLKNSYGNDGKIYGLPIFRSTPIIYYNMDILKQIGITQSQLPKNWNELREILQKLKNHTGEIPMILPDQWYDWLFESFVFQSGGALSNSDHSKVLFNHSSTIEALTFWKELIDKGLMKRRFGSWKSAINLFANGKYPVVYYSTGGMGKLQKENKINWTTTIMPKNKVYGTSVGAASIFLSNYMKDNEKKAAWKFTKFLLAQKQQVTISLASGYLPVIKSAYNNTKLEQRYNLHPFAEAKKQLEYTYPKIMVKNYSKIREILKKAITRSLDKGMPPKQSLNIAQKEAQKWLK